MRASVASITRKFINAVFAATLALGLVPAAAFAQPAETQNSDAADAAVLDDAAQGEAAEAESSDGLAADGRASSTATDATPNGSEVDPVGAELARRSDEAQDAQPAEGENADAILAVDVINQEVALDTVVAQAESTRTFFLAQTLESTRTVPIVSAKLPLDNGSNNANGSTGTSQDGAADASIGATGQPGTDGEDDGSEAGEGPDDPDLGADSQDEPATPDGSQDDSVAAELVQQPAENTGLAPDSVVVGSFTYLGMTFAMEPGGETVALVAVDYNKLPQEFVQRQVIVIPEAAQTDDGDLFSVTRIADGAFAGLTAESANQDYLGCELLFSDEELLAEAGIDSSEIEMYLNDEVIENDLESSDEIRTIVSIEGDVATLDDGTTYTFTNPLACKAGILALGIPASVTSIGEEALWGENLSIQYVVVSDGNQNYASYDGALYSADLTQLRLIPEGRVGAVRVASSAASVNPEVFSHCPSAVPLTADADGRNIVPLSLLEGFGSALPDSLGGLPGDSSEALRSELGATTFTVKIGEKGTKNTAYVSASGSAPADGFNPAGYNANVVAGYTIFNNSGIPGDGTFYISQTASGKTLVMRFYPGTPSPYFYGWSYRPLSGNFDSPAGSSWEYAFDIDGPYEPVPTDDLVISTSDLSRTLYVQNTADPGYSDKRTVTWHGNGASLSKDKDEVASGSTAQVPDRPELDGWTFGGWYAAQACEGEPTISANGTTTPAITADTHYYAKWTREVTFHYQDGQTETTSTETGLKKYGDTVTDVKVTTPAPPTRQGKSSATFKGWGTYRGSTTGLVGEAAAATVASLAAVDGSYDMYARWQMVITLNPREGKVSPTLYGTVWNATTAPFGNAAQVLATPTREGYRFNGWKTESDGSGDRIDNGSGATAGALRANAVAGSATLYAGWDPGLYTVKWVNEGSEGGGIDENVAYKADIAMRDPGVRDGYVFKHWLASDSVKGTYGYPGSATMGDGDATFTAVWEPNEYCTVSLVDSFNSQPASHVCYWPDRGFVSDESSTAVVAKGGKVMPASWSPLVSTGYEFLGYFGTADQSENADSNKKIDAAGNLCTDEVITGFTTWFAHWRALDYTLSFANATGEDHGTLSKAQQGFTTLSRTFTLPTIYPIEHGYEFAGFTASGITFTESLAGKQPGDSVTVGSISNSWTETAPVATVQATYRLQTFNISYDVKRYKNDADNAGTIVANDATGNPATYQYDPTQTAPANQITVSNAPSVTRAGYKFKGWYCPTIGERAADAQPVKTVTVNPSFTLQDLKFQAAYELVQHTVTLNASAGAALVNPGTRWSGGVASGVYTYTYDAESEGAATRLRLPAASKSGHAFAGYSGSFVSQDSSDGEYYFTLQFTSDEAHAAFSYDANYAIVSNGLTVMVVLDGATPQPSGTISTYTTRSDLAVAYTVNGTALGDLTSTTKHAYRFTGWTADTDCLVDGAGNAIAQGTPAIDASIKAGLTSEMLAAPKTVYAHFAYAEFPLYASVDSDRAQLVAPNWNIVTDAAELARIGVAASGVRVYKYAYGYNLSDGTGAGITIPEPTNQGMKFNGWNDSQPAYASELSAGVFKPVASPAVDAIGFRLFTAKWVDAPYTITFANVDHVRSIDLQTASDAAMAGNKLTLKNSQLDSGVSVSGVTVDPDFYDPQYGFKRFVVKGIDLSSEGWTWEGGQSWRADGFDLLYTNITKYFPGGADALTVGLEFNEADITLPDGTVVSPIKHYTASLNLEGGALAKADADYWGEELKMDFTHETSGDITLPTPLRTGFSFAGWTGAYDDANLGNLPNNGLVGTTYQVPAGSVHDRTYTAHWTPKTTNVKFVYNAVKPSESYYDVPAKSDGTGFALTYGRGMNDVESIKGYPVPTRPGYRFLGFFDTAATTGGKQYYTSTLESARSWDKDSQGMTDYTLYARWTKVDDPENIKVLPADPVTRAEGYITAAPDSRAAGAGSNVAVFDASYTGVFAWETFETNPARPASSDTVTIDVSSYTFAAGFDINAVPAQFNYSDGGKDYKLLGFYMGSGKYVSTIKMTDLLQGCAFQLKVKGHDLVLTGAGSASAPSFVIDPTHVTPFYTTGDPGYSIDEEGKAKVPGDGSSESDDPVPPNEHDIIVTYFNAGDGTFPSIKKSFTAIETEYLNAQTRPNLPEEPSLAGHRFTGWSTEEDHVVNDGCTTLQSKLEPIETKAPMTYYAHYEATSSSVDFVEAQGIMHRLGTVLYGDYLPDLGASGGVPVPAEREGFVFKGYFDSPQADGAVQYVNASGQAVRPWDKTDEYVTLYALWVADTGDDPVAGTPSDPSGEIDPNDPFPGVTDPVFSVPTKVLPTDPTDDRASRIKIPVSTETGSCEVDLYAGTYDGMLRFTDTASAGKPSAADNVEATIFSYVPDAVNGKKVSAHTAHERVRTLLEENAPDDAKPYLQGFTVLSTGCFIPLRELHEGRAVTVRCMGSDLEWTYGGNDVTPASVVFKPGKVVAVYAGSPCIDPGYDWPTAGDPDANPPVPATQVISKFNAGVGRFGAAGSVTVETTTFSSFGASLTVPRTNPVYGQLGYEFEGWYYNGQKVEPASCTVDWTECRTYYARYRQVNHTITLKVDGSTDFATITAWHGQPTNSIAFSNYVPQRSGYEFAGWYAYDNDNMSATASAKPYYMALSSSPNSHLAVSAVTDDVTLFPYWRSRSYTVNWVYNHGSFDLHTTSAETWHDVDFNEPIGRAFPEPENTRFEFLGWYATSRAALQATAPNGNAGITGAENYFIWDDAAGDYVFRPAADKDASVINIYAGWSQQPKAYTVKLEAGGVHGAKFANDLTSWSVPVSFDRNAPEAVIDIYDAEYLPSATEAGWRFDGWMERMVDGSLAAFKEGSTIRKGTGDRTFVAQWAIEEEGGYSVRFLLGDEPNTSMWGAPDFTDWYYEQDHSNRLLTTAFDAGTELVEVPQFTNKSITGYDFAGWQRVSAAAQEDGSVAYVPMSGTGLDAIGEEATGFTGQRLVQIAADESRYAAEETREFVFQAVWIPKSFDVRYFVEVAGEGGSASTYQEMAREGLDPASYENLGYNERVILPYPAFREVGSIFEHWDGLGRTDHNDLVAGESKYTVRELIALVGESSVSRETADDGSVVNHLNLYAASTANLTFSVTPQVSIAFDPDDPYTSMMASDSMLKTTSNRAVRVESVSLERLTEGEPLKLSDESAVGDGSSLVNLMVQGYRAEDRADVDDDAYLEVNLGPANDGHVFRDLGDFGFASFTRLEPLRIDYRLRFAAGYPTTANGFVNLLGIQDQVDADGERLSLPVAKLFFTVGLATSPSS